MTPTETVNEFMRLVCANELAAAAAMCTEDVEYDNVPMGKNLGRQAMIDLLTPMIGNMDAVDFIVHREAETGSIVMNERTDRFTKGDKSADIVVAGVFELSEAGEIALWRDYFDLAAVAEITNLLS